MTLAQPDTNPIIMMLDSMGIHYRLHHHQAVFTVAEANSIESQISAFHTKNLLLTDKQGGHHLVCIGAHQRLNIKEFGHSYHLKDLHFASSEDLYTQLHTTPGSVSLRGIAYQTNTTLYLDPAIIKQPALGRHPNDNTMTLVVSYDQMQNFLSLLNIKPVILKSGLFLT